MITMSINSFDKGKIMQISFALIKQKSHKRLNASQTFFIIKNNMFVLSRND